MEPLQEALLTDLYQLTMVQAYRNRYPTIRKLARERWSRWRRD